MKLAIGWLGRVAGKAKYLLARPQNYALDPTYFSEDYSIFSG